VVPTLGRGGAERQAILTALALRDNSVDVRVFVQSLPDALFRDGITGSLQLDMPPVSDSIAGQIIRLRRSVEEYRPDAVITFLRGAVTRFAIVRATSRLARSAAWIIAARGNLRLLHITQSPAVFAAYVLWLRAADRICVNSSDVAANLFAMDDTLASKVVVIPNVVLPFPVDALDARARVDAIVASSTKDGAPRRPIIGCLGSFQDERNYQLVADALPAVLRAKPGTHVIVVGRNTGPWISSVAAAFRERLAKLGLGERVTIAGEIAGARSLLAGFDVFALPSKLEGSSNALAEAMVAGVPTVTVPLASAVELVDGSAVTSRGFTPSSFAQAIVTALDTGDALRARAASRGKVLLEERSSVRVGERWASLVADAVTARRGL
jgi:glycosyltransferase involved in cell wall biosynthesis